MSISWIRKDALKSVDQLHDAINRLSGGIVGIGSNEVIARVSNDDALTWLENADVVHSGLAFGGNQAFTAVQLCTFNWHFLNPMGDRPCISWKATTDFVIFEKRLVDIVGPIDQRYSSMEAAIMDWVYRALIAGAKTLHRPIINLPSCAPFAIDTRDEMLFVCKYFNRKAQRFYQFAQFVLQGKFIRRPLLSINEVKPVNPDNTFKLASSPNDLEVTSYSALIPTIDRYDYIGKSIDSLLALRFPPQEIIIIDQTDPVRRRSDVYATYIEKGLVKVTYLDKAGQSTARNRGLEQISTSWVLLFEDDSEAWPDMVDEHIQLIRRSGCDVSTGVIVPPSHDRSFIPERNRRYFLSDIFTTGNAFMRVETALEVGGLDPAFDHGPGADDDFGKRLYRSGKVIIYNYKSIETHHKAPMGGMRVHGIWWRNKSTVLGPYPPVTQMFSIMKYYQRKYRPLLVLNMVLKARKKYSPPSYLLFLFLLPYKLFISVKRARKLPRRR